MALLNQLCYFLALLSVVLCCNNPEVTTKSFTTQDATIVTHIAFISEFQVKCSSGQVSTLYAELNGNIVPVSVIGSNHYQVSWIEDIKTARSGDKAFRVFDEDGYTVVRKAIRSGEDPSTVPALFDVIVNYPGAYNGPWLKSELFATIISLFIAYFAVSFKLKVAA